LETKYVGAVGDDEAGRFQQASLRAESIDLSDLDVVPGADTQMAVIIVESHSGERTILWKRDERLARPPGRLAESSVRAGRVLLVDGHEMPLSIRAARIARTAGMPVVLDIDSPRAGSRDLLGLVDFPIVSETFAPGLTGIPDLLAALGEVRNLSPGGFACATLGRRGALVLSGGAPLRAHPPPVAAADTTGAGDVFHGGFVFGLLRGWDLERTVSFATAAASLNCTAYGARGGIRERQEVERVAKDVRVERLSGS
ncbi:MAG: carbohydrate kinase family protein, partial [Myxococcota bacterium]